MRNETLVDGARCRYFVLARSEADARVPAGKAFTAFVVDGATRGITKGKKENMLGQRASATSAVKFEDVLVPNQVPSALHSTCTCNSTCTCTTTTTASARDTISLHCILEQ